MMPYGEMAPTFESNDSVIVDNIGLVKRIALHLAARLPSHFDTEDLMQAGMVGLIEAAKKFDSSRGASFATYAGIRIRGAMLDMVRKNDWTPRSVYQKHRLILEAVRAVEAETGRSAEPEEVAAKAGISLEQYQDIVRDAAACQLFSLDEAIDESTQSGSGLPVSNAGSPEHMLDSSQRWQSVADAILRLPERERLVLSLYYEREMNLKEIGAVLGVSESRACQIHGQAIIRIRAAVDA
jgi:RNA polymerase sigma factor for flagellar operon FliA